MYNASRSISMNLDTTKWDLLSGIDTDEESPGMLHESLNLQEEHELERLRMIIREEVQAAFNEIRAAKDITNIAAAMKEKNVGAAMGFTGPGFGGNNSTSTSDHDVTNIGRPTHGLMKGPGF
jgi:hypothetical protein